MLVPEDLQGGDVLLYAPTDWVGWLIAIKTWTMLSHVEVYAGAGKVIAARPRGVDFYTERLDYSLRYIRRPVIGPGMQFDLKGGLAAVHGMLGKPYEVAGLLRFYLPWHNRHKATRICSSVATVFLRGGGCEPFNPELNPDDVSPAQLWQTPELTTIWSRKNAAPV